MDDEQIIALYQKRNETAVNKSSEKYGRYCSTIADNILHCKKDTEECVNDTWLRAWNAIPPEKPGRLSVFLGRITRNLAIDRYRNRHSRKHGGDQVALCLDELSECVGDGSTIEDRVELKELMNKFLESLPENQRNIFMYRYWYILSVSQISVRCSMTEGAVKMTLARIRTNLRKYLTEEGVPL